MRDHGPVGMTHFHDPPERYPTPSAFADWVFHMTRARNWPKAKTGAGRVDQESVRVGEAAESELQYWGQRWRAEGYGVEGKLELVFDGTHRSRAMPIAAAGLQLDNQPFLCKPDLVLADEKGNYLVVEIKGYPLFKSARTMKRIPQNGWENHQAQLWCYAWLDLLEEATSVALALDYRGIERFPEMKPNPGFRYVRVAGREPIVRDVDELRSDREIRAWFARYGGRISE